MAGIDEGGVDGLWLVGKGVSRLVHWGRGRKVIWNALECTQLSNPGHKPTPEQVRSEVWMSPIHGSTGIIYFVHQWTPTVIEAGLLADLETTAMVKSINQQIHDLAPVLNSPTLEDGGTATSGNSLVPVDVMVKQMGSTVYMFAVGMRNLPCRAHLTFDALHRLRADTTVEVLGENRTISASHGHFEDEFTPYQVHLYKTVLLAAK